MGIDGPSIPRLAAAAPPARSSQEWLDDLFPQDVQGHEGPQTEKE